MNIRPIRTQEEHQAVLKCGQDDDHSLIFPTHVMMKDNYIVGSLSVMPSVLIWLSRSKTQVRDTLFLKDYLEGVISNTSRVFSIPCDPTSPLKAVLDKKELQYFNVGQPHLYIKGV